MPLKKRQAALLARPLASLKKLSPHAQNSLVRAAHEHRNPQKKLDLTPKSRKHYLRTYTIGDVFEEWKRWDQVFSRANPTRLTCPSGIERVVIAMLVKVGFTRFDLAWIPQETLTLKAMRTRPTEEWLKSPLYLLGTLPRAALTFAATECNKHPRDITVQDLLTIHEGRDTRRHYYGTSMHELWRWHTISMTNTQTLLYKLGFTYEDSPFMQHNTDRKAIDRLTKLYKIGTRTARMVIRIARGESWHVRTD